MCKIRKYGVVSTIMNFKAVFSPQNFKRIIFFLILIQNKELDEFGRKEKTMVWRKKKSTEAFRLSLRGGLGRMAVQPKEIKK